MWIQTQNKQRIINSDQIIDIFVDKTGTKIMAETTRDGDFFELGCYENRQICLEVMENVAVAMFGSTPILQMPLGGDIERWAEEIYKIAVGSIVNNFTK